MQCRVQQQPATPCQAMAALNDLVESGLFTLSYARNLIRLVVQGHADLFIRDQHHCIIMKRVR